MFALFVLFSWFASCLIESITDESVVWPILWINAFLTLLSKLSNEWITCFASNLLAFNEVYFSSKEVTSLLVVFSFNSFSNSAFSASEISCQLSFEANLVILWLFNSSKELTNDSMFCFVKKVSISDFLVSLYVSDNKLSDSILALASFLALASSFALFASSRILSIWFFVWAESISFLYLFWTFDSKSINKSICFLEVSFWDFNNKAL